MTPFTVINCLTQLLSIFGACAFIHSDRSSSFQSYEFKSWLLSHGVTISQTTRYNPRVNGQCEKYNGIICKAVLGALKSCKLPATHWEYVMIDALHNIRSLLCSSIDCTPQSVCFVILAVLLVLCRRQVGSILAPFMLNDMFAIKGISLLTKLHFWCSCLRLCPF